MILTSYRSNKMTEDNAIGNSNPDCCQSAIFIFHSNMPAVLEDARLSAVDGARFGQQPKGENSSTSAHPFVYPSIHPYIHHSNIRLPTGPQSASGEAERASHSVRGGYEGI